MASGRFSYGTATYVDAPEYAVPAGGLLDLAEVRDVDPGDPALRGFMFESELIEATLGTISGFVQSSSAAMVEGASHGYEYSFDPFTIYGAFGADAGGGDTVETVKARAEHRLEIAQSLVVERALWEAGGIIPAQASIPRTGAMKAKIAVGLLAEVWSSQNVGVPFFLGGRRVANEIASQQLVEFDEDGAQVKGGVALINGAGFFAKTPIGGVTPTADQAWLCISGKPLLYRSAVRSVAALGVPGPAGTANNRLIGFAMRTYVPSIDGPIYAALVDLTL